LQVHLIHPPGGVVFGVLGRGEQGIHEHM
jgi:hypothetical protein